MVARLPVPQPDASDYDEFKSRVLQRTGIDLNLYKHQQMHRRLLSMVDRAGASSFLAYYEILERDQQEYRSFLDRLTINVSELFRNPERWRELRHRVLPPMLTAKPQLRIWSAGCSYGAEPYSIAILLAQIAESRRDRIVATDIDAGALARAREGAFSAGDVRNVDAVCLSAYFQKQEQRPRGDAPSPERPPGYRLRPEIRERVEFSQHNLLADAFLADFDLICCRNVIIYFTDEAKEALFRSFFEALAPGGVLFLGGTERMFRYREIGFENLSPFFYRRPAYRAN